MIMKNRDSTTARGYIAEGLIILINTKVVRVPEIQREKLLLNELRFKQPQLNELQVNYVQ